MISLLLSEMIAEIKKGRNLAIVAMLFSTLVFGMFPLLEYAKRYDVILYNGEGLLYVWCDDFCIFIGTIGLIIGVSEVPFLDEFSKYEIVRSSRQKWLETESIRLALMVIIYYSVFAVLGFLIGILSGANINGLVFSSGMKNLMGGVSGFDTAAYFPYSQFAKMTIPECILKALILQILFAYFISLLLFLLSLCIGKVSAYVIVVFTHIAEYVLTEWVFPERMIKYILWANTNLAYHKVADEGVFTSFGESVFGYILLILIVKLCLRHMVKKVDLVQYEDVNK